jgi:hypothetical protein
MGPALAAMCVERWEQSSIHKGGATITAKVVCHSITYFTRPFKNDLKVIFLHYLHIPICYVITFFYESSSIRVMVFNATFNNVSVILWQ